VAVYNHYQRLKHEDGMAQLRREREAATRSEFDDFNDPEPQAPKHSDPHSTPWPPPSREAMSLINDRPVTRGFFGANTSYEAR